ncbi:MAG: hypothetical protein J1E84_03785 [Muribaculaceae bacterium]|nr:hypothetical protein [Muribaculaceae bacterium]
MKKILYVILIAMGVLAESCIEDGISTSPSDQPVFSVDTLNLGTLFTTQASPTFSFVVYNRHDKVMNISDISMRNGTVFRVNVDGVAGHRFSNVEIRPNDSIFVFVEATLPEAGQPLPVTVDDYLDFVTNGVTRSVVISATGQDVKQLKGFVVDTDMTFDNTLPYQIYDSLVVKEGATLTLTEGTKLHFHDKASLKIHGTLRSMGSAEKPVEMLGDRIDNVVGSIPFDLMASQWEGVEFHPGSKDNYLQYTCVRNTVNGVIVDSLGVDTTPGVVLVNCRLRNSAGYSLISIHSHIEAVGCEIADAAAGVVGLYGGYNIFNHCTFANYYLFTAVGGPTITLNYLFPDKDDDGSGMPFMTARFTNSIIYDGLGRQDISHGDLAGSDVIFNHCLFKSAGDDDEHFLNCLWDTDPLFFTVRNDYIFDYRVQEDSPAIDAADPLLTDPRTAVDWYNVPRIATLGAYQYTPAEQPD